MSAPDNAYVNLTAGAARYLLGLSLKDGTQPDLTTKLQEFLDENFGDPAMVERKQAVRGMAESHTLVTEGTLEVDDNAVVSEGDDNGAYVMAWLWVPFADTELDKEKSE